MENLDIYNKLREVPAEAQRPITGGKLKGKTDINPMWRIKSLTEQFGPCGVGWKLHIVDMWTTPGANGEVVANVKIHLFYKLDEVWSEPIEGIGGSMLVATEKGSLASNDEAFKMAYTDAISVACKALGMGANIYWAQDATKYTVKTNTEEYSVTYNCQVCGKEISKDIYTKSLNKYGQALCSKECLEKLGGNNE